MTGALSICRVADPEWKLSDNAIFPQDAHPMTIFSALVKGLRPHDLPVQYESGSAQVLRNYIEQLRFESFAEGRPAAVVSIDTRSTYHSGVEARFEQLFARLDAGWAHEYAIGWLDEHRIGVVLPSATASEAMDFGEYLCDGTSLENQVVRIYARDVLDRKHHSFAPIEDLYVVRTPIWKRIIDIIGASFGLIVAFPMLVIAAVLVKLTSRGPFLFSQWRVGRGGRPFRIFKIRTMRDGADDDKHLLQEHNEQDGLGFKIADDPRITKIGKLLRRTSIDEIPQLLNVVRGEMSIVGPRPLPCSDWKPNVGWICRRHDVVPGLTCTWQVSGRSNIGFDEWMRMDIDYIESQRFSNDVALIFKTLPAVVSQRGAS